MKYIIGKIYDHEDVLDPLEPNRALVQDGINTYEKWQKLEEELLMEGSQFRGLAPTPLMDWNEMREEVVAFHVPFFNTIGKMSSKLDRLIINGLDKDTNYSYFVSVKSNKYSINKKLPSKSKAVILKKLGQAQEALSKKDQWQIKVSRSRFFGGCTGGEVVWKDSFVVQPRHAFSQHNSQGNGRELMFKGGEFEETLNLPKDMLYGGMVVQIPNTEISMQVRNIYQLNLAEKSTGQRQIEMFVRGQLVFKSQVQTGALVAEPDFMILPPQVFQRTVGDGKTALRTVYLKTGVRNRAVAYVKISRSRQLKLRALEVYTHKADADTLQTEHKLTPLASSHLLDYSTLPILNTEQNGNIEEMGGYLQEGEKAMLIHSWTRGDFMLLIGKINNGEGDTNQTQVRDQRGIQEVEQTTQLADLDDEDDEEYEYEEDEEDDVDNYEEDISNDITNQPSTSQQSPRDQQSGSQNRGAKAGYINFRGVWLLSGDSGKQVGIEYIQDSQRNSSKYKICEGDGNPFKGAMFVDLKNNSFKLEREGVLQNLQQLLIVAEFFDFKKVIFSKLNTKCHPVQSLGQVQVQLDYHQVQYWCLGYWQPQH
eukprot:TRINITY_DN3325_c0_g1_i15.p1 TRINITY_DN3325_c0_g1~~TRINITY_DN3325_c0_g1_i15.p1  ORF type:complete len:673 (-),score=88.29 TRINITY_DN3325_c0_g1_i15:958-2736(-)